MKNKKIQKGLSGLLCAALLSQSLAATAGAWWSPWGSYNYQEPAPVTVEEEAVPQAETYIQLKNGTAVIPAGSDLSVVKQKLAEALVDNLNDVDPQGLEWEYYCEGKTSSGAIKQNSWGSISGFTSDKKIGWTTYSLSHPALADNDDGTYQVRIKGTADEVTLTKESALASEIVLNSGVTITIPLDADGNTDFNALREAIFRQVVDSTTPNMALDDVTIEYYATAKTGSVGGLGKNWAPLSGGKVGALDYPAISAGTHQIRISYAGGNDYSDISAETSVTLENKVIPAGGILLNEAPYSAGIAYNENGTIDYAATEQAILAAVVAGTDPAGVPVTVEYDAKNVSTSWSEPNWKPLSHTPGTIDNTKAFGAGSWSIRLSFAGTDTYTAAEQTVSVEMADRERAPIVFEAAEVKLGYTQNEDGISANVAALESAIRAMFTCEGVDLSGAVLEYYATAKTGSVGSLGQNWAPLAGGKVSGLDYPAISEGTWNVRLVWGGSQIYAPTTAEGAVTVTGREKVSYTLKAAPYEVGMAFNPEQGYDYDATIRAIYGAVVESTDPAVDYEAVKMEYTTTADALGMNFKPLDHQGATGLLDFKDGTWMIRISWPDTVEYRSNSVTVEVTVSDNRTASAVVLKEGVSFTYNMDSAVMERAIFDNVIDWENSDLPQSVDISSFEIKYKAQMDVLDDRVDADKLGGLIGSIPGLENIGGGIGDIAGSLGESTKRFMPISGGEYLGVPYAPMGAGEHQVQITFKGSADYKPSDPAEAAVTVDKANVKVKVHSGNIRAGEPLPAGFITTDPADKFEFYTIYAGATSNVNLGIYIDLPDKYGSNNKLIKIIDPVVEKIAGKSFSQMLQDGVTLGELRGLAASTELIDLLEKLGVDTGAFGQIIKVVSALPSITDGVRVGFGTPNRAGLYTATAITDNKNYNTGVGVGALLVRMHLKGVKLTWNQALGKQISAAEAKNFDFRATLSLDGDVTISQESVHYLYSGFTSKWKPYSSTTKAPTEPGRYTMTVVTLGGNYQAAPITRSFQITK